MTPRYKRFTAAQPWKPYPVTASAGTSAPAIPEIGPADPQIYVAVRMDGTGARGKYWSTPFQLTNEGGAMAHNAMLEGLAGNSGEAHFEEVQLIPSKQSATEIMPVVTGYGEFEEHDVTTLLREEESLNQNGIPEVVRMMKINYRDAAQHKFETTFELVYHRVDDEMMRAGHGDWPAAPLQIRNVRLARLS